MNTQARAKEHREKGVDELSDVIEKSEVIMKWVKRFSIRHKFKIPLSQMPGDQILSKLDSLTVAC